MMIRKLSLVLSVSALVISSLVLYAKITKVKDFRIGECIVDSTIPPWDKNNVFMVSKVLLTSKNHVQLTQAPYYLGEYTMNKKDLQNYEVVPCPPVEVLPEETGETCGH